MQKEVLPAGGAEKNEFASSSERPDDVVLPDSSNPEANRTRTGNLWSKLRKRRDWRLGALIVATVICLLGITATVLIDWWVVPTIWRWGFQGYQTTFVNIVRAAA